MATQVQIRRGTTAGHTSFTGVIAELTFDTDLKTIRAHDGSVAGGTILAKSSDLTTANVSEVTNLYYTNARVFAAVTGNLALKANVIDLTTANVSEVTNLYYTNARVYSNVISIGYATNANVALKANLTDKLNVFAATTSSELLGIISDETGSGALVFGTSPAISTSLTTPSASFNLVNTTATTVNFAGAGTTISIGAATGTTTVNNSLTVSGNLQVSGTTTTVNSTTLEVADKNITIAKGAANSAAADGAGITVDGASATFNYVDSTTAWTSSQDINLASGKVHKINGTQVLSSSGLGSDILASNLTSVGTISTGTWNGSSISTTYTDAKVTSVGGTTGAVSNAQLASSITTSGLLTTANVTELTNLYFTNARVYSAVTGNLVLKANVVDLTTANVIELNSLYFTDARARQAISSSGCTLSYSNTTGIISFSQGDTDTVNEGSTNLYYTNARVFSAVTGNLALKANLTDKLSVFAATTSSELLSIISDETGTGSLVFNASPTFTGTITAAEISASGNVTSPFFYSQSDINLKKDLVHVTNALDIVTQLDGYWFKWKSNDADSLGMIAQHVESVLPMLIGTSPDGYKTIQYNGIIAILLEAIKAQQIQIDEIKAKLDEKL